MTVSIPSNFKDFKTFPLGAHRQLAIYEEINPEWREASRQSDDC